MKSSILKERLKEADRRLKLPPGKLMPVDMSKRDHPPWMTRAYVNNRYVVMIQDDTPTTHGPAIKAMIQTVDDQPIRNHWPEIQKIKNEIFGPECVGIEYYPAESKLINTHNIYWLWIFPPGVIPLWTPQNPG